MAENIVIGAKIQTDAGQATESVKSWKAEIKAAKQELKAAAEQYGELSAQAIAAARKVAELNDAMGDQQALVDKLNPDAKFAALAQGVQGAVGAFSALTGAMAAFGVDSENVEKTLMKVQGAMAMTQGINSLLEAKDGLKQMGAIVGGQLVKAFHALKAAIGGTGIGLLVIALAAVVAYWDKIKGAVTGYNAQAERSLELAREKVKVAESELSAISDQENTLRLQGMSEREILKLKILKNDEIIKAKQLELENQKTVFKGQVEAEARNRRILEGALKFVTAPLQLLLDGVAKVGKFFGKDWGVNLSGGIAGMVFDPVAAKKKQDETLAEMDKGIRDTINARDGLKLSLQNMDKQEASAASARRTESIKREKDYYSEIDKIAQESFERRKKMREDAETLNRQLQEENLRRELSSSQIALRNLEQEYSQRYATLSAAGVSTVELERWFAAEKQKITDEEKAKKDAADTAEKEKQTAAYNEQIQRQINLSATIVGDHSLSLQQRRQLLDQYDNSVINSSRYTEEERTAILAANAQARIQLDGEESGARQQALTATASVMGQVAGVLGKHTAAGKAMAVAQTTIDTYQSATGAYKSLVNIPFVGPVLAPIAAGAAIVAGLANVRKILAVNVPNGGGVAMPSVPSAPSIPSVTAAAPMQAMAQATTTRLDSDSINAVGNATSGRAYVLDSDVRSASERNTRLNRAARLG